MYSWRDGTKLQGESEEFKAGLREGFAPPIISPLRESHRAELERLKQQFGIPYDPDMKTYTAYHFLQLHTAVVYANSLRKSARAVPKLSVLAASRAAQRAPAFKF